MKSMKKQYGKKNGEKIFYASKNKGVIKEKEELGSADTVKAEPVQKQADMPSIRDMSDEDRKLYFDAQKREQFVADPEKMRLAVIRLLRDKYNL